MDFGKLFGFEFNPTNTVNGDGTITISGPCVFTGTEYSVTCNLENWKRWKEGELIQRALPELSAEDREFIKTGISPTGWDTLPKE